MKLVKTTAATFFALLLSSALAFGGGIEFEHISLKKGLEKARSEGKLIFIDLYATWCGPCKMLSNSTFKDDNLGNFMNDNFVCLKIDGEKGEGEELMTDFDIDAFPTMLFLSPDKELIKKLVGFVDAETVLDAADKSKNPEKTVFFQLNKKFQEGNREKELMQNLIEEGFSEEKDISQVVETYLELFPDLNLEDRGEFIVFGGSSDDTEDPHVIEFLSNAKKYKRLHGDLAEWKMRMVIMEILFNAAERGNNDLIHSKIEKIYPAYKVIYADEAIEKEELEQVLIDALAD